MGSTTGSLTNAATSAASSYYEAKNAYQDIRSAKINSEYAEKMVDQEEKGLKQQLQKGERDLKASYASGLANSATTAINAASQNKIQF